ncbi:hypothetical protein BS78_K330200 [Paspalum vaginatum]|uniref:Uncharacterized protein n=1 Tax=Paspalum vaginatum TaxID=158149 RepID=A0A9W7XDT5_9POAL|nr:hypothetical protein BS78_K330200 [Paspalum vaginatum]
MGGNDAVVPDISHGRGRRVGFVAGSDLLQPASATLQGCRPRRWELMLCYKMLIMRGRGPFFVDYAPYAPWRP